MVSKQHDEKSATVSSDQLPDDVGSTKPNKYAPYSEDKSTGSNQQDTKTVVYESKKSLSRLSFNHLSTLPITSLTPHHNKSSSFSLATASSVASSPRVLHEVVSDVSLKCLHTNNNTPSQTELVILFCLCHSMVGFSMGALSPAMEPLTRHFGLSAFLRGAIGASALIGNILGSPMGGYISDKWGRKICICVAWMFLLISSMGQAMGFDIRVVLIARCVLGWAVGAHYSGITAYLSESFSPLYVDQLLALVEGCFFLGNFLSVLAGYFVAGFSDNLNWRLCFAIPAIIVSGCIIWFVVRGRESQIWKDTKLGRHDSRIEIDDLMPLPTHITPISQLEPSQASLDNFSLSLTGESSLRNMRDKLWVKLFFVSFFWGSLVLPTYAISAFAVHLITELSLPLDPALLNTLLSFAACVGVFIGIRVVACIGPKRLLLLSQWGVAAALMSLAGIGIITSDIRNEFIRIGLPLLFFFAFELLNGVGSLLALVYPARIFPSEVRGLLSGLAAMNSRFIAVTGILLMSIALDVFGPKWTLISIGIFSGVGAVVTHILAPRESISTNLISPTSSVISQDEPRPRENKGMISFHHHRPNLSSLESMYSETISTTPTAKSAVFLRTAKHALVQRQHNYSRGGKMAGHISNGSLQPIHVTNTFQHTHPIVGPNRRNGANGMDCISP